MLLCYFPPFPTPACDSETIGLFSCSSPKAGETCHEIQILNLALFKCHFQELLIISSFHLFSLRHEK